jgi:hypothetical protein
MPLETVGFRTDSPACTDPSGKQIWPYYTKLLGEMVWIAETTGDNACLLRGNETPRSQIVAALLKVCSVPYFGESGDVVYVGAIERVWQMKDGSCHWDPGPIVELPRDEIRLRFRRGSAWLGHDPRRPIVAIWDRLASFVRDGEGEDH